MGEKGDKLRDAAIEIDMKEEEIEEIKDKLQNELELSKIWLYSQPLDSHENIVKNYAKKNSMSLTDANKRLEVIIKRYEIEGNDIPDIIKQMRMLRRNLKGEKRMEMSKAIDSLLDRDWETWSFSWHSS